jgi:hypothetical protein
VVAPRKVEVDDGAAGAGEGGGGGSEGDGREHDSQESHLGVGIRRGEKVIAAIANTTGPQLSGKVGW